MTLRYMVMECHLGYAVVLDGEGRFLKVANLHYEVGDVVSSVVMLQDSGVRSARMRRILVQAVSAAACLCVLMLGARQLVFAPYGTVRIQINPDVELTVNYLNYVTALTGLNADGKALSDGYEGLWKRAERVAEELADRAEAMGFLSDGDTVYLAVNSAHARWRSGLETRIVSGLEAHLADTITVLPGAAPEAEPPTAEEAETIVITIPSPKAEEAQGSDGDDGVGKSPAPAASRTPAATPTPSPRPTPSASVNDDDDDSPTATPNPSPTRSPSPSPSPTPSPSPSPSIGDDDDG